MNENPNANQNMDVPHMTYFFTMRYKLDRWEEFKMYLPCDEMGNCTPNLLRQLLNEYVDAIGKLGLKRNGEPICEDVRCTIPPDDKLFNAMKKWHSVSHCAFLIGVNRTSPTRPWLEVYCYPKDDSPSGYALKGTEKIEDGKSHVSILSLSPKS